jgi:23S rRNA (guanosine2251-2'-O)-methyltransferase
MSILSGIHPVGEALRAGSPLERIVIAQGAGGPRMQEIIDLARRAGVPVRFEPRAALDRKYAEFDSVADSDLLVVLDGVEDPHNLGAIIRTAHAAGAGAVIIPERRAASLTDVVAKSAAGALEHLPVARVTNVNRTLEELKRAGHWIYGLDERGTESYDQIDYASKCVVVLGGEGKGLHEQVRKHCDMLVRIPMAGKISSLNVSVAAGIVLFELRKRVTR